MSKISIVVPAYNETGNLPLLHQRLGEVLSAAGMDWEMIIVDDHSRDETFAVIRALAEKDPRVRGLRLARNSGSHTAILCGLELATGDVAVFMAADLQDPPETLPELLKEWRNGAQVVWAVRNKRPGEKVSVVAFARLFYFIMRRFARVQMPASGADFALLDRRVLDALKEFGETHVSLMALITWMGFRQSSVSYDKPARTMGVSGWTLEKKLKLVADSVTAFSYFPIRFMSYAGFLVALLGFLYAIFVIVVRFVAPRLLVPGWSSLMAVVLVLGGIQMLMLGVLGEYLWRVLDESRQRPRYLIEESTPKR